MGLPGWWAIFWPVFSQKNVFWPLKGLNLASPSPPGTYFESLYPAKIDLVPGQPKKWPGRPHFRNNFYFFGHFWHLATHFYPHFLALKWPWDPSKKIWAEISYPMVPVRRQETPWVRFYGQISEKNWTHFWPHHSGTPTTLWNVKVVFQNMRLKES